MDTSWHFTSTKTAEVNPKSNTIAIPETSSPHNGCFFFADDCEILSVDLCVHSLSVLTNDECVFWAGR